MINYECFKNGHKKLVKIEPVQTLWDAVKKMGIASTNFALVCDKNTIQGFYTQKRHLNLINSNRGISPDLSIKDVALKTIYFAKPNQDLSTTIQFMKNKGIKSLPIMDEEVFLGILDLDEAIDILLDERAHMISMLEQFITGTPFNNSYEKKFGLSWSGYLEQMSKQLINMRDFQKFFQDKNTFEDTR